MLTHHKAGCQEAWPCWTCASTSAASKLQLTTCHLKSIHKMAYALVKRICKSHTAGLCPGGIIAVIPFCLQAKLDPVNGHSSHSTANHTPAWLACRSLDGLEMKAEMPQHCRPVMHSDLGNGTAAVQVHSCLLGQFQSMIVTISMSNSPSLARLHASSCSSNDCMHK